MDYQYDAFFSYRHHPESDEWHDWVRRKLHYWTGTHLGYDPRFFFDRRALRPGDAPNEALLDALRNSKCLVCFWSPRYFNSPWCRTEWRTFVERGKAHGLKLVLPASIHDGESFPEEARATLWMDFSEFHNIESPAFFASKKADKFGEKCLRPFGIRLAEMIKSAPQHGSFPIVESDEREMPPEKPLIRRPADE